MTINMEAHNRLLEQLHATSTEELRAQLDSHANLSRPLSEIERRWCGMVREELDERLASPPRWRVEPEYEEGEGYANERGSVQYVYANNQDAARTAWMARNPNATGIVGLIIELA